MRSKKVCNNCGEPHYAHGLCTKCYYILKSRGSLDKKTVANLHDEEWRPCVSDKFTGLWVSTHGRIKNCNKRNERLIKTRIQGKGVFFTYNKRAHLLAPEILRSFVGHEGFVDLPKVVYKDKNRANVKLDNLAWYGREHLLSGCIEAAEKSDNPLADCFLKFFLGDHNALNDWFGEQLERVTAYITVCVSKQYRMPWLRVNDIAQESIYNVFMALYRGLFKGFESLNNWVLSIAGTTFKQRIKRVLDMSIDIEVDGKERFTPDHEGYCNPSAEYQAIYNEEFMSC